MCYHFKRNVKCQSTTTKPMKTIQTKTEHKQKIVETEKANIAEQKVIVLIPKIYSSGGFYFGQIEKILALQLYT